MTAAIAPRPAIAGLAGEQAYGYLDEFAKREIRRVALKAVCIPGFQVPYASREMPARLHA